MRFTGLGALEWLIAIIPCCGGFGIITALIVGSILLFQKNSSK
jgi:hypothetical protein